MIRFVVAFVALALFASLPAFASDGVLEINQVCATSSTGCFPGDPGGFPVVITAAGSYRLTGNLTVPANTTAINITSPNVTLDLGGFHVAGPNVCSGTPVTSCTVPGGGAGIAASSTLSFLVVVRNGRVSGMAGDCIDLGGDSSMVDHVAVFHCGGAAGINLGNYGRVTESSAISNRNFGIRVGPLFGGTVEWSEARGNGMSGIIASGGNPDSIFVGNRALNNASTGIQGVGLATKNVLRVNGLTGIGDATSLGDNLCEGVKC